VLSFVSSAIPKGALHFWCGDCACVAEQVGEEWGVHSDEWTRWQERQRFERCLHHDGG